MFDVNRFKNCLQTHWLGKHFWYFKKQGSTNGYVKSKKAGDTEHGLTCLADCQEQGRGLYGKTWEAEPDQNLTFSIVFKPDSNKRLQVLNLMAALSASEVLQKQTGLSFQLKWPNDVYYDRQKIGGLLTETSFTGARLDRIILGIGLNINQKSFSGDLIAKACSLSLITQGQLYSREEILAEILLAIENKYSQWQLSDAVLIKSINQKLVGYGKWVKLKVDDQVLETNFKLLGLNRLGLLHALNDEDEIKTFTHEEVRIHQIID